VLQQHILNDAVKLIQTSYYCYRRGLANALVNLPFMIIPWIAAFIANSALGPLGWRRGIGLFAIILPICSLGLIIPLFLFQRRMAQLGAKTRYSISPYNFVSHCDLGGMVLMTTGFALLLLPLALAGTTPSK
jgi:MFS family permease